MRMAKLHPILKCLIGLAICYLPILIINLVILKPVFLFFDTSQDTGRLIRFILNSFILLILYQRFLHWTEKDYAMNWRFSSLAREIGIGAGMAICIITISVLLIAVSGNYQILSVRFNLPAFGYLLIIFAFMALLEEILFRGIIYRIVEQWLGSTIAFMLSSILFSLPHLFNESGNWITFLSAAIGGVILGLLFTVSKQIWLPFGFHMFWNFAQVNFGSNLSGSDEFISYAIVAGKFSGSHWITGGLSGIENSAFTISLTLIFAVVLYYYVRREHKIIKVFYKKA